MGGKSSKASNGVTKNGTPTTNGQQSAASVQLQQRNQLQAQIDSDLEKKRPTSRRIADQWNLSNLNLPAYALETLDEDSTIVVRHSIDQESENPQPRRASTVSSDGAEALVYVFNPERVVSRRVSKRISVADENLILERMSQSIERLSSQYKDHHGENAETNFTMVNIAPKSELKHIKSCDASVIGRTGSTNAGETRGLCQDEAHFEFSSDGAVVFGVFDGHGPDGHLVAALCAKDLSSCLLDDQTFYLSQNNMEEAVRGGMASFQRRLDEIPPNRADIEYSGATATIGYVAPGGKVWIANVGDTRAVGARRDAATNKLAVVKLSDEHICSEPSESERITKCGGRVSPIIIDGRPIGPPRCWFGHEGSDLPGLMVTRTLGDSVARSIGVNAECSMYHAEGLAFLIVASDGLWEVMSSEEAIGFVGGATVKPLTNSMALSELLCLEAKRRWMNLENKCGDDISALVIAF